MGSHKSALKKQKQDRLRRQRNRSHLSRLKTDLKKVRAAIARGDVDEARRRLPGTEATLDHSATLGVIHKNAAARTKSRIARQVASLGRA